MRADATITPRWLSRKGAAAYSGLSIRTIDERMKEGAFKSPLAGGKRLIDRLSLDAWIEDRPIDDGKSEAAHLSGEFLKALESVQRELAALRRDLHRGSRPRWLKLPDAARYSGLSTRTLKRRLTEGAFASKLVGAVRLIDRESLDVWIEDHPSDTVGFKGNLTERRV